LQFLNEVWPAEPDEKGKLDEAVAINVLGEWFGYVLSGRTDLHKMFLHVGPTRGGKGLIARVETALLGKRNVAGPTLHSLCGEFGLAPLIGKSLAVISDARFGRTDSVVVERLLSISGEDTLTVNRKYREQWTGKLGTRMHVISNELPKLGDASAAIVGRFVVLMSVMSWLGKEDVELEDAIRQELAGVLNWSLDGLRRLVENGNRFTRAPAFDEVIREMRDLASPVNAFVRQDCEVGVNLTVKVDDLYAAYRKWAEANGHRIQAKETFGRDLLALPLGIRKTHPRDKEGPRKGKPIWHYEGIDIRIDTDPGDKSGSNNKGQPVSPISAVSTGTGDTGDTGCASLLAALDEAALDTYVRRYISLAFDADGRWVSSAKIAEADVDLRRELRAILQPEAVNDAFNEITNRVFAIAETK
jgi:putative DNA primase/helicase